jgi:hypothetical protein
VRSDALGCQAAYKTKGGWHGIATLLATCFVSQVVIHNAYEASAKTAKIQATQTLIKSSKAEDVYLVPGNSKMKSFKMQAPANCQGQVRRATSEAACWMIQQMSRRFWRR